MQKTLIDCYGHSYQSSRFMHEEKPCDVDSSGDGNTIYQRFDNRPNCAIIRITQNENLISYRWTFGAWDNRVNLEYNATPKETLEIEVPE